VVLLEILLLLLRPLFSTIVLDENGLLLTLANWSPQLESCFSKGRNGGGSDLFRALFVVFWKGSSEAAMQFEFLRCDLWGNLEPGAKIVLGLRCNNSAPRPRFYNFN
jgi:hypothetical protein